MNVRLDAVILSKLRLELLRLVVSLKMVEGRDHFCENGLTVSDQHVQDPLILFDIIRLFLTEESFRVLLV